ncbi:trace amine-associated receptor 13c-like [Epinephelus fuscoguttatus]|uniref:trace amine-associated receptor 13c-like n=1 Tax=Epinephelus fuscoguttatus TaxID=293821 RepID=UPI0020D014E5|nr:trace amine-associated receptor 13c-like [Epinephelus fuscoguttatus]
MEVEDGAELCFPQLLNTSCRKPTTSWPETMLITIVLYFISVFTAALNLLVIIAVSHFRQLHTPTNILLLSLAVSDFLVGLLVIPGELLLKTSCWLFGDIVCTLCGYICFIIVSSSVGNMVLISVDRYVAICDPLHYTTRITVRRVKFCVCLCWLGAALYWFHFIKDDLTQPGRYNSCHGECVTVIVVQHFSVAIDLVISFIAPITVVIVLYMRVFVVAVSQARAMRSHITAVTLQLSVSQKKKKSELKAARTLGVLVIVFLICYCPYFCVALAGDNLVNSIFLSAVGCLFYCNSCLNPLIYALSYSWFRKAVKLIVSLQILQPGSCETNIL